MTRLQEDDRLRSWLQARGWQSGYSGWSHPTITREAGFVSVQDAYRLQVSADREAATSARNINIRDADVGMDDAWRKAALAAIRRVAAREREFTTDAILDEDPTLERTDNPRVLGPVMLYAAKDGLIAPTDRYVSSSRRSSNARAKRQWRSLVYCGHAPQPQATEHLEVLEAVR